MATSLSTSLAKRRGMTCSVHGCTDPVKRLSNLCQHHETRQQDTGHPLGTTVTKRELAPYVEAAEAFIVRHANHKGIIAALAWLDALVKTSSYRPVTARSKSTQLDRIGNLLCRYREIIPPHRILAHVFGVYAMREVTPHRFKSDGHFDYQLARRVLRITTARYTINLQTGKAETKSERFPLPVARAFASMLKTALGVLALRAGREIAQHMTTQPTSRLPGEGDPFDTTAPST